MNNYCQERKLFQLSSELKDAVLCWVLLTAVFSSTEKLKGSWWNGRHIDQRARRELKGRCPLSKALLQDLPLPQEHPCTPTGCVRAASSHFRAGWGWVSGQHRDGAATPSPAWRAASPKRHRAHPGHSQKARPFIMPCRSAEQGQVLPSVCGRYLSFIDFPSCRIQRYFLSQRFGVQH